MTLEDEQGNTIEQWTPEQLRIGPTADEQHGARIAQELEKRPANPSGFVRFELSDLEVNTTVMRQLLERAGNPHIQLHVDGQEATTWRLLRDADPDDQELPPLCGVLMLYTPSGPRWVVLEPIGETRLRILEDERDRCLAILRDLKSMEGRGVYPDFAPGDAVDRLVEKIETINREIEDLRNE